MTAIASRSSADATGAPWKFPARYDPFVLRRLGEDERVVGDRVDLDLEHPANVGERVARRAVDLGHAAQRVGVLDLAAVRVALRDPARVPEERPQPGRRRALAGMGPGVVDAPRRAPRACPACASSDIAPATSARLDQPLRAEERERADRGHGLGAVDERDAFLRRELERLDPGRGQRLARRHPAAVPPRLPLADQREPEMGERGQVAARAHRSLRRDPRPDARVQVVEDPLAEDRPHTRAAAPPACSRGGARSPA